MKDKLLKLLKAKQELRAAKMADVDKAADVKELREHQASLESIDAEIRSLEEMIAGIEKEDDGQAERTKAVNQPTPDIVKTGLENRQAKDPEMEYRTAFMNWVASGIPIDGELRVDANTKKSDIPGAIPTVLVNKIIEKMELTGVILPLVTKTTYKAGMAIPASSVKPVATWVNEGAGSGRQKKSTVNITFGSFKLRCEISMSLEVGVMALSAFEAAFVANVSEAMVKKLEATIVGNADGTASPKGILAETVADGQNVDVTPTGAVSFTTLTSAEGLLPAAYDVGAVWFMTKKTFMAFQGMVDTEGHPIARVNYGLGGAPDRNLLGRKVIINDYMNNLPLTTPSVDTVFAFLFNPSDYALNTVYDMGVQRKQDWETDDELAKAVWLVDGKVVDKNSLVTLTKKA